MRFCNELELAGVKLISPSSRASSSIWEIPGVIGRAGDCGTEGLGDVLVSLIESPIKGEAGVELELLLLFISWPLKCPAHGRVWRTARKGQDTKCYAKGQEERAQISVGRCVGAGHVVLAVVKGQVQGRGAEAARAAWGGGGRVRGETWAFCKEGCNRGAGGKGQFPLCNPPKEGFL